MSIVDLPRVEDVKRDALLRQIRRKPRHERTRAEQRFLFANLFRAR